MLNLKMRMSLIPKTFICINVLLGQIQQDDAEQQIEYVILRNNLKDVFFTDGDAVNAKISNSSPSERAEFTKNTVKTLLGVEIIEKMYSRLDNQTKRIDKEIRLVAGAGDLSTILDTIESKKDNLDSLKEELNQVNIKKSDAQKVYDLRDQDLKNCLAAGGQDRKDLLDQLSRAEARYKNAEASVETSYKTFANSLNNDLIAPLIAAEAIDNAQVFLNDLQEKQIIPNYKPDLMRLILKNQECVCGSGQRW